MNPELQKYIRQARSIGKSNEVITQELASGGWTPADISQALNLSPVSTTGTATSATVTGGVSAKIIASIVTILLILGAGGYFVYSKNKKTLETNVGNNATTPQSQRLNPWEDAVKGRFSCGDLFKAADYARIVNEPESSYKLIEWKHNYDLECNSSDGLFSFSVWWGNTSLPNVVNSRWNADKENQQKEGLGIKDLSEMGSEAFATNYPDDNGIRHLGSIEVLSTDKNYIIYANAGTTIKNGKLAPTLEFEAVRDIAKIIAENLNKY